MANKITHWSELPALSTLGGWDLGLSMRGVAAYQWLRVRTSAEYMGMVTRAAQRAGKDLNASLMQAAEIQWSKEERAA